MYNNHKLELSAITRINLVLSLITVLTACGSVATIDKPVAFTDLSHASVSGFVVERDGVTPVYGATIAVLSNFSGVSSQPQRAESSQPCVSPAKPNINYVCSQEDGSFMLDLSQVRNFPVTLRIESQNEAREITLQADKPENKLGLIALTPEDLKSHKGKVAVVMDFYNPIKELQQHLSDNPSDTQNVALELMNEYQHLFEIDSKDNDITYPTFYSLFVDKNKDGKADIFDYDAVYINSRQQSDIAQLDKSLRDQLTNYINNGGQLFITEWTVELEQEEPSLDQYI